MPTRKPGSSKSRPPARTASKKAPPGKTGASSSPPMTSSSKSSARSTQIGPARADLAGQRDALDAHVAKREGTQALAEQMPHNASNRSAR